MTAPAAQPAAHHVEPVRLREAAAPRPASPPSLRRLLRRAHLMLALGAVAIVGVTLAVPAIVTLHLYADHSARLVARAVRDTIEAAAVFEDREAAQEALEAIVAPEEVSEGAVILPNGTVLAEWHGGSGGWRGQVSRFVSHLLLQSTVRLPVVHAGIPAGEVIVRSSGGTLVRYLAAAALGILICQALIVIGALYLSKRILGRILAPVQALAAVTGTVQRDRAFGQRVPGAEIKELNELGKAFNSLLAELDSWQSVMAGENARLMHQASHDSLTGLPNRAFFEGRLNRALLDAEQTGTGLAVMLIDCDDFKTINDSWGHASGDAVLIGIAARLKGQLREHDLVARLAGDEFAVLIAPAHGPADLRSLSDAIASAMRIPIDVRDELAVVASLSVGISVYPDDATTPATLLQRADEAMYRAKRAGAEPPVASPAVREDVR